MKKIIFIGIGMFIAFNVFANICSESQKEEVVKQRLTCFLEVRVKPRASIDARFLSTVQYYKNGSLVDATCAGGHESSIKKRKETCYDLIYYPGFFFRTVNLLRNFKKGKRHGEWVKWHHNGVIDFIVPYKEGKLHGKEVQFFDINRKKISTPSYKNGSEDHYKKDYVE